MYPDGMVKLYSNFTPRKSRIPEIKQVVVFGIQHFCLTYLIDSFNREFFWKEKESLMAEYSRHVPISTKRLEALHDLGYLPIEIKALPEGTLCPIGVPVFTITNTHPDFAWLVNYLETLLSCMLWQPMTSATIAYEYKKLLTKYALETTGSADFVQWQGHDFSMRGMSSVESAILSGMGHLLSFSGTDTIPAIYQLEHSYSGSDLIGASVPATEHSVMCMGTKDSEIETFKRLLSLYPTGILSVVSDTWDLWKVITVILPALKSKIMAREGKLVIRPDSGNPVDIICGKLGPHYEGMKHTPDYYGVIELLWEIFGGTYVTGNDGKEYKLLDSHIGAIYGDSITLDRAEQICKRLQAKGFASTNVVLGIGSFTYQYNTRDTFGFAMKATYGEVKIENKMSAKPPMVYTEAREIWKDPVTDDGTKKSAKGLLCVLPTTVADGSHTYTLLDQCTPDQEAHGALQTVFKDGRMIKTTTLAEIRERLSKYELQTA
jgi:nicotinamide phosphoribosyltransferase